MIKGTAPYDFPQAARGAFAGMTKSLNFMTKGLHPIALRQTYPSPASMAMRIRARVLSAPSLSLIWVQVLAAVL